MLERMWRKGNPSALSVGMQTGAASVENGMGRGGLGQVKMKTIVLEQQFKK